MSRPLALRVAPEIALAVAGGGPVVALESTVIAHGLPWPDNLELGRRLEEVVREAGAVPATIAVLDGLVRVGLTGDQLERVARSPAMEKVSRRDFGAVVARRGDGATTVAGTVLAARWAGIRIMATGGIGGVHRGDRTDVSADLPEIAGTPVMVVSAGAKAILDLAATLEWLETHGVPVIGYGTREFPAFYSRESGLRLELAVETGAEAAEIARAHWALGLGGLLLAVPCPEGSALPAPMVEAEIIRALADADTRGISGKRLTPFLLARLGELTGRDTLRSNLALLERNARVAAEVALALAG